MLNTTTLPANMTHCILGYVRAFVKMQIYNVDVSNTYKWQRQTARHCYTPAVLCSSSNSNNANKHALHTAASLIVQL